MKFNLKIALPAISLPLACLFTGSGREAQVDMADDIDKVGPLETWTYNVSNRSVEFVIAGSTVTLRKTDDKAE